MLSPLLNQTYRRLFIAQATALLGTGLSTVALALLAYDLAGGSAGAVLGTALALKMIAYVGIAVFSFGWETFWGFVYFGFMYNNVILDLPLSSIGASLLWLDPAEWVEVDHLISEQRHMLVPLTIVVAFSSVALGLSIGFANNYYRVWILQQINQNLRMHLMSQLQALSLKFHAESRTGDTIYRFFQDSAMVTQILQAMIVDPFLACVRFFMGVAVVAAFSPFLAFVLLLTWGPMLYLGKRMSAPLRLGFKEARETNAALTSTIQESIEGIRTIKVNGLEDERQTMFEHDSTEAFRAAYDSRVRLLVFRFLAFVFAAVPLVFVELRAALYAYEGAETFMRDLLLSFGFAVWNLGGQDQARSRAKMAIGSIDGLLTLWGRAQDMAIGLNRVYQEAGYQLVHEGARVTVPYAVPLGVQWVYPRLSQILPVDVPELGVGVLGDGAV